ncbi:hypothetical protein ACLQ28_34665, partial [Micromonospora sp. DT201]|uniref:hypothetical protein n=1 Tax=Micromonospora sp. DT201 TaxID=3393442 RepID=UPI003CF84313
MSFREGEGHALLVHGSSEGLRWFDPQLPRGQWVTAEEPAVVRRSAVEVRVAVLDADGRVVSPGSWSTPG